MTLRISPKSKRKIENTFLSRLNPVRLEEKLAESYLGILIDDSTIFNPLENIPTCAHDKFAEYIVYLMSQPDYFYFLMKYLLQIDSYPMQCVMIKELFSRRFPMLIAARGGGKSFALAVYLLIRMILTPDAKCIITSAGFRQAKVVFDYMEVIWKKSPVLQSCFKGGKNGPTHGTDVWTFRLGNSITYALPVGPDGSKVRGYRANFLIAEEFASVNRQVFEEVMSGFLSVAASPIEQLRHTAKIQTMKTLSIPMSKNDNKDGFIQNQLILSGTAYYKINHFYTYFKKWHDIISATGDRKKLKEIFGEENINYVNSNDYGIMRIPIEKIVGGYMDMEQISRIKASTTKDVYLREFSAVFSDDSDGFFRKSLIDSCTAQETDKSTFPPMLYGDKTKKYVYGIDPAYEGDNFAIVILELNGTGRRVVHAWTTQASDHKQMLTDYREGKLTMNVDNDYYHYCVRKIRNLMKRFPCEFIAIDPQGGGRAIIEAFMDQTKLQEGEQLILPSIEPEEKAKETDMMTGLHIIKIINFTSNWISDANHALKKDMEDKALMFPFTDEITYALAEYYDESSGDSKTLYDTLDDCIYEIDELKKELTTVVITETSTGKEKFDTPSIKTGINKKGRLKKDRYSALLLSNWIARGIILEELQFSNPDTKTMSGFVGMGKNTGSLYIGNPKIAKQFQNLYDF